MLVSWNSLQKKFSSSYFFPLEEFIEERQDKCLILLKQSIFRVKSWYPSNLIGKKFLNGIIMTYGFLYIYGIQLFTVTVLWVHIRPVEASVALRILSSISSRETSIHFAQLYYQQILVLWLSPFFPSKSFTVNTSRLISPRETSYDHFFSLKPSFSMVG